MRELINAIPNVDFHDTVSHRYVYDPIKDNLTFNIGLWDNVRVLDVVFVNPILFFDYQKDSLANLIEIRDGIKKNDEVSSQSLHFISENKDYKLFVFLDINDQIFHEIICKDMTYQIR